MIIPVVIRRNRSGDPLQKFVSLRLPTTRLSASFSFHFGYLHKELIVDSLNGKPGISRKQLNNFILLAAAVEKLYVQENPKMC
jgi:hypothetical protein